MRQLASIAVLGVLLFAGLLLEGQSALEAPHPKRQRRKHTQLSRGWTQEHFVISMWSDPLGNTTEISSQYAGVRAANFTTVMAVFGDIATPAAVQAKIQACQDNDLGLIIHAKNSSLEQLPWAPAVVGYHLQDEPGFEDFPRLQALVANVSRLRPDALSFINLLPNYNKWFNPPLCNVFNCSYKAYVTTFLDMVKPPLLCVDNYPTLQVSLNGSHVYDQRWLYVEQMAFFRQESLARGIPFWTFFQSMPYGARVDPTVGLIRWQANIAVTYGATGVLYFAYWDPEYDSEFPFGGALITHHNTESPSGLVPGAHYEQARAINSVLRAWGPTLMKLTSTGVTQLNVTGTPQGVPGPCLVTAVAAAQTAGASRSDQVMVGCFRHVDGRLAATVTNYDYGHVAWVTVVFDNTTTRLSPLPHKSNSEGRARVTATGMSATRLQPRQGAYGSPTAWGTGVDTDPVGPKSVPENTAPAHVRQVSPSTGLEEAMIDASPRLHHFQVRLAPGAAVLYIAATSTT